MMSSAKWKSVCLLQERKTDSKFMTIAFRGDESLYYPRCMYHTPNQAVSPCMFRERQKKLQSFDKDKDRISWVYLEGPAKQQVLLQ